MLGRPFLASRNSRLYLHPRHEKECWGVALFGEPFSEPGKSFAIAVSLNG